MTHVFKTFVLLPCNVWLSELQRFGLWYMVSRIDWTFGSLALSEPKAADLYSWEFHATLISVNLFEFLPSICSVSSVMPSLSKLSTANLFSRVGRWRPCLRRVLYFDRCWDHRILSLPLASLSTECSCSCKITHHYSRETCTFEASRMLLSSSRAVLCYRSGSVRWWLWDCELKEGWNLSLIEILPRSSSTVFK